MSIESGLKMLRDMTYAWQPSIITKPTKSELDHFNLTRGFEIGRNAALTHVVKLLDEAIEEFTKPMGIPNVCPACGAAIDKEASYEGVLVAKSRTDE